MLRADSTGRGGPPAAPDSFDCAGGDVGLPAAAAAAAGFCAVPPRPCHPVQHIVYREACHVEKRGQILLRARFREI